MADPSSEPPPLAPSKFQPLIEELCLAFPKAKFELTDDAAMLASQISKNVPESERTRWHGYLLKDLAAGNQPQSWLSKLASYSGYIVLAVASFVVLAGILAGLLFPSLGFRKDMADPATARGVITFLFAFGTISIALLIAAASYWVRDSEELKARFGYAKDILMVLIGILGTIIGFYFGTQDNTPTEQPPLQQTEQPPAADQ